MGFAWESPILDAGGAKVAWGTFLPDGHDAVDLHILLHHFTSARPADLEGIDACRLAEPEMQFLRILRLIGRPAPEFPDLHTAARGNRRTSIDRRAAVAVQQAEPQPVASPGRVIAEQERGPIHDRDEEIEVAVLVVIAHGQTAGGD